MNDDHDEVVNRAHYLRIAALVYRDFWVVDSTIENWRRWYWAKKRYEAALSEGEYQIGMAGEFREEEGMSGDHWFDPIIGVTIVVVAITVFVVLVAVWAQFVVWLVNHLTWWAS